jgi:hypothetical protein
MDERLKLGDAIESRYSKMVLRVEQRMDHLHILIYDSESANPNVPVWEGDAYDIADAKDEALQASRRYIDDPEVPTLTWERHLPSCT